MLNTIKMDWLRMRKAKSFYVILGILAVFLFLTVLRAKTDVSTPIEQEKSGMQEESEEIVNLGISFDMTGQEMSPENIVITLLSSGLILVFTSIFAVILVVSEYSTGFIKNIAGIVKKRCYLILSKGVIMAAFIAAEFVLIIAIIYLGMLVMMPDSLGRMDGEFLQIFALQYVLHLGFGCFVILLSTLTRSKLISILCSVLSCSGLALLLLGYLERLLEGSCETKIKITNYLLTTNVSSLVSKVASQDILRIVLVAFGAMIVYMVLSCVIIEKRDI